jgi:XTP/dITP diphosphohydrolase
MEGVENRRAYFACALALVYPNGDVLTAEGRTYGKILFEETGDGGFGYDCLFESEDLKKSFGVATAEEKNTVSHRFRALQGLLVKWKEYEGK